MTLFKLHPYQQKLVDKARNSYKDGYKSPCVVAPCGAGKSVIIAEVVRMTTKNKNRVLFLVHRSELIDQIKGTLIANEVDMDYVQLGMVQTIVRRLDKTTKPDLIVTDENHHGLAASYRKIYTHFDEVLRLGFTATPIRLNGSGLGDVNDILLEEVDAEWLIENEYLSPYKYYAPKLIKTEDLKLNNLSEFSSSSIDKALEKNTIYGDVVKHYQDLADGEQAIAYCHSIKASNEIAEAFNSKGIKAVHIDAKTKKKEREEIIQQFRNQEIKILCNVDLIGEGFDVPDCSTVIMLRPTQSLSLFIQQSMRGMRYKPNKTSIIIDHVDNISIHGLPDSKREWSLKVKKKNSERNEVKVRQCDNCYGVYLTELQECPLCGFKPEIKVAESNYEIDEAAELEEVNKEDFNFVTDFREPEDCKDMKELYELAKNRGYKRGWAWHQGKLLGLLK